MPAFLLLLLRLLLLRLRLRLRLRLLRLLLLLLLLLLKLKLLRFVLAIGAAGSLFSKAGGTTCWPVWRCWLLRYRSGWGVAQAPGLRSG